MIVEWDLVESTKATGNAKEQSIRSYNKYYVNTQYDQVHTPSLTCSPIASSPLPPPPSPPESSPLPHDVVVHSVAKALVLVEGAGAPAPLPRADYSKATPWWDDEPSLGGGVVGLSSCKRERDAAALTHSSRTPCSAPRCRAATSAWWVRLGQRPGALGGGGSS